MNKELLKYFNNDELAVNEIWKILDDNKHAVSNHGRILNIQKTTPFLLKPRLSANTYYITFKNNLIHRLVAKHFVDNNNNYKEVNHIDGNKLNNHYSNLEWCTRSENICHAYKNKLRIKYSEESSKLTREEINKIRYNYSTGEYTQKELAIMFNVKQQNISKIINYKRWK